MGQLVFLKVTWGSLRPWKRSQQNRAHKGHYGGAEFVTLLGAPGWTIMTVTQGDGVMPAIKHIPFY